jgi:hypothetical protein
MGKAIHKTNEMILELEEKNARNEETLTRIRRQRR